MDCARDRLRVERALLTIGSIVLSVRPGNLCTTSCAPCTVLFVVYISQMEKARLERAAEKNEKYVRRCLLCPLCVPPSLTSLSPCATRILTRERERFKVTPSFNNRTATISSTRSSKQAPQHAGLAAHFFFLLWVYFICDHVCFSLFPISAALLCCLCCEALGVNHRQELCS